MLKRKKTMELLQIYFKHFNNITIITNFLAFFLLLFLNLSLLDPDADPEGKMNADSCGFGSTAQQLRFENIYKP